jgi:hypothetical protein
MNGTNNMLSRAGSQANDMEKECSELPIIGPTMTPRPMAASTKPVIAPTLSGRTLQAMAIMVDSTHAEATPLRKRMNDRRAAAAAPDRAKGTAANDANISAAPEMEQSTCVIIGVRRPFADMLIAKTDHFETYFQAAPNQAIVAETQRERCGNCSTQHRAERECPKHYSNLGVRQRNRTSSCGEKGGGEGKDGPLRHHHKRHQKHKSVRDCEKGGDDISWKMRCEYERQ